MQKLYEHITNYCDLSDEEFQRIKPFFKIKTVDKKTVLYEPETPNLNHYFVLEGCLHLYSINERGSEQTLQFAINNWWITDYLAFQKNESSSFYIQAVHTSKILEISFRKQEELFKLFPKMESYFRQVYQTAYGAAIMRIHYIFSYSKEDIYFQFIDAFPEFANNIPQYLIATFLGLSPEYVSKLRRKHIS